MISIYNNYSSIQREILFKALEEAQCYVCNNSPSKSRGCQACPVAYSRVCRDLRSAADHIMSVEKSVENVEK